MSTLRFFFALALLAAGCALLIAANAPRDELTAQVLVGHSRSPRSVSTIKCPSMSLTRVRAQASSCSFVNCVISFRPFVAAPDTSRSACAADSPVMGDAARRAQHQTDLL